MALERRYICDGPECQRNAATISPPPYMPGGYLVVREQHDNGSDNKHFCGWDCVMKFAATIEPEIVVGPDDEWPEGHGDDPRPGLGGAGR